MTARSDSDVAETVMTYLRGEVFFGHRRGQTYEKIAQDAHLSHATVSRFANGETKRPHGKTVLAIAEALGTPLGVMHSGRFVPASQLGKITRKG